MNTPTPVDTPFPTTLPYELATLASAKHYQGWMIDAVKPFLGQHILELGAGIGNMSRWLTDAKDLIVTEHDPQLLAILEARLRAWFPERAIKTACVDLTSNDLTQFMTYNIDTIISFNVLEHIEEDQRVLAHCANLLRHSKTQGRKQIITFVPAHTWAYGAMDKAVNHYRRYTKKRWQALHQAVAPEAKLILRPFNFVGLWGWWVNGRLLQRTQAGSKMVNVVERCCPLFKAIDHVFIHGARLPLGQSLIAIQTW